MPEEEEQETAGRLEHVSFILLPAFYFILQNYTVLCCTLNSVSLMKPCKGISPSIYIFEWLHMRH
jgi:hypothetical protein